MLQQVTATLCVVGEAEDLMAFIDDQEPFADTLRDYGLEMQENLTPNSEEPEGGEFWLSDYYGARVRPSVTVGLTVEVQTAGGKMFVTVNVDEHRRPMEVFLRVGKAGEIEHAHLEGLGRMISYCLRIGGDPEGVIDHLRGITSEPIWDRGILIRSAEDGVAYALHKVLAGEYDEQLDRMLGVIDERARAAAMAHAEQHPLPAATASD